jgi:PAS domain S-box-containing protein
MTSDPEAEEVSQILPLIADDGNRQLLTGWIDDHPNYEAVEFPGELQSAEFDLCIIDKRAFKRHLEDLRDHKSAVKPVLVPYLLLRPEGGGGVIDKDSGELADNVVTQTIDELVSLPIKQAELHWRLQALLRLRDQSLTLRKRERQLERQVDLFEKAQDISNVGAWEYDIETETTWFTEEAHRIYGVPIDEEPSVTEGLDLYHSENRPIIRDAFEKAVAGEESFDLEFRLTEMDGAERWVRTRGEAQYRDGEPSLVRGTIQDTTQRKAQAETLRLQKQTVDDAPIGITISDPDQEDNPLIYVNDAFVEMTGYDREEAVGRNCRFLQGAHTDPDQISMIREAIDSNEIVNVEIRNYRKDGTEFWNHLQIAPVYEDSEVVNYIGFQEDVTDRKEREEQFAVLDRVLRHNIRNDMNVIRGRAETIQAAASGELATSAAAILDTSDELLDLAEKERQITTLLRESTDIAEHELAGLLDGIAADIRNDHTDALVTIDCPAGATVEASIQLEEAIYELMTNAAIHNFASEPEITVTVSVDAESCTIAVADDGPRIPAMEREMLGSETEQTPLKHKRGLGLWFVRLVVARSGGSITISGREPGGNVVSVELPM